MKVQGSLKEKKMPDHFYLKEKFQPELSLGCVKFFFSVCFCFCFYKSSSATEIQHLMEQMVEVLESGTFVVMLLNAKH